MMRIVKGVDIWVLSDLVSIKPFGIVRMIGLPIKILTFHSVRDQHSFLGGIMGSKH